MNYLPSISGLMLALAVIVPGRAAPRELAAQVITLPVSFRSPLFADAQGNGRCDLLVIDETAKTLLIYRQQANGFTEAPDQAIALPPQTAWIALCDVDPHPGLELLASTAGGLVFCRQNGGRFDGEWHDLIKADQVFTNTESPRLISLENGPSATNILIPVIQSGQVVQYRRNDAYEWRPLPPQDLATVETRWSVRPAGWAMNQSPAHTLVVQRSHRPQKAAPAKADENPGIQKIRQALEQNEESWMQGSQTLDLNGDGREDLVLWQVSGNLDFKTDVYVFLRGADGRMPEHPSQTLHGRGFPVPNLVDPIQDLAHDGRKELVLVDFKTAVLSADGLLKTALSHGLDWALTIRPFEHNAFARLPAAAVPVTMILPAQVVEGCTLTIRGDFNGDGRPELLVRRTDTQWNIFLSTTNGTWFEAQPALTFTAPVRGTLDIRDLRGDGRADIIWRDFSQHRLTLFWPPRESQDAP